MQFETFLRKQFAELRRELGAYAPAEPTKEGKVLSFESRGAGSTLNHPWQRRMRRLRAPLKYGIAAAVLVGVAVPMVLQLNQQKAELKMAAESTVAPTERKTAKETEKSKDGTQAPADERNVVASADLDEIEEKSFHKNAPAKARKKSRTDEVSDIIAGERNLKATREEAKPKGGIATGKTDSPRSEGAEKPSIPDAVRDSERDRFAAKKESPRMARSTDKSGYAMAEEAPAPRSMPQAAPAAPAAAPAPTLSKPGPGTGNEASGGDRGAASSDVAPAEIQAKTRSIQIDDAKQRMKQQQASEDEKNEMEKLWREFEKNPQAFNKDKARRARLDALLARHDRKSRAKRMRAIESQATH